MPIEVNFSKKIITFVKLVRKDIVLNNGDGFSFVGKDSCVNGFRGDVCSGTSIRCKSTPSLYVGAKIFRNINIAFEKEIERKACTREIRAVVSMDFIKSAEGIWTVNATALSEDGRKVCESFEAGDQTAGNHGRMLEMIRTQIGKSSNGYRFSADDLSDIGLYCFAQSVVYGGTLPLSLIVKTRPARTLFRKNCRLANGCSRLALLAACRFLRGRHPAGAGTACCARRVLAPCFAWLFTKAASFAMVELATESFFYKYMQAFAQCFELNVVNYLTGKGIHKQVACFLGRNTTLLHIE